MEIMCPNCGTICDPLRKSEMQILKVIRREGERTYYHLWKKDKVAKSNKTVQEALKKLLKRELIKPKRKTTGTERKPYILTQKGASLAH